jgi:hypothetical protein
MMAATALAEKMDTEVATHPASDSAALIAVISRAASDPNVDIDKMERLMAMHERMTERAAKTAYAAALAEMQPKLPVIDRRGAIVVRAKDAKGERTGEVQQNTAYALWEDINDAIRPLLAEYGFALSFRLKKDGDRVEVTGVLSHREGYSEETVLSLPMDTTGSKNNVQAIGSSTSYGKRYTAMALLNITTRGEDDDGKAAGLEATITDEQFDTLSKLMDTHGANLALFCQFFKIDKVPDLPASKYEQAVSMVKAKRK